MGYKWDLASGVTQRYVCIGAAWGQELRRNKSHDDLQARFVHTGCDQLSCAASPVFSIHCFFVDLTTLNSTSYKQVYPKLHG